MHLIQKYRKGPEEERRTHFVIERTIDSILLCSKDVCLSRRSETRSQVADQSTKCEAIFWTIDGEIYRVASVVKMYVRSYAYFCLLLKASAINRAKQPYHVTAVRRQCRE